MDNTENYYECRAAIERAGRAYRYMMGALDQDDAYALICECEHVAGWYSLEAVEVEATLDLACERWGVDREKLRPLVAAACVRVARKWGSTGDTRDAAEEWALDLVADYAAEEWAQYLVADYAADDCVALVEHDELAE